MFPIMLPGLQRYFTFARCIWTCVAGSYSVMFPSLDTNSLYIMSSLSPHLTSVKHKEYEPCSMLGKSKGES